MPSYISLIPNLTEGITLPPDSHLTLAFMEETNWEKTLEIVENLASIINGIKEESLSPLFISGWARFRTPKNDALVALINPTKFLDNIRKTLIIHLLDEKIIPFRTFGWVPHITLGYSTHEDRAEAPSLSGSVYFDRIRFKEKGEKGRMMECELIKK